MENELKPCPFCGGKAYVARDFEISSWTVFFVRCICCLVRTNLFLTKSEAISAWNRREK